MISCASQGCVSDSPHTSFSLETSSVPLVGQGIRVYSPSFRSSNSPQVVHKTYEASLGKFEGSRCEADRRPGRLPDHRQNEARSGRSLHEDEVSSQNLGFIGPGSEGEQEELQDLWLPACPQVGPACVRLSLCPRANGDTWTGCPSFSELVG